MKFSIFSTLLAAASAVQLRDLGAAEEPEDSTTAVTDVSTEIALTDVQSGVRLQIDLASAEKIGDGAYGDAFKVETNDGLLIVKSTRDPVEKPLDLEAEFQLRAARLSPFVAQPVGLFEHDGKQFFAMRPCDRSAMWPSDAEVEAETFDKQFTRHSLTLMRQALMTAQLLHENGILHQDLHGGNLMMRTSARNDATEICMIDFGNSENCEAAPCSREERQKDYEYIGDAFRYAFKMVRTEVASEELRATRDRAIALAQNLQKNKTTIVEALVALEEL